MGWISWLLVGGMAGWLASMMMGTNARMGLVANIIVGIMGAMIGGFVLSFFGIGGVTGLNLWSMLVATMGAILLLYLVSLLKK
jgi:uncharacterized membrane protein YeaQ/YmgE (transglycosylase-associated protein family)